MEAYSTIVNFFQNGGVFMYPIVLVLALGVAIAVERWVFLTMTMAKNKALWKEVTPFLKSGNLAGAMQVTSKSNSAIAQIMTYGLNRVRSARRREDVEQAMEESLMEVMPRLEKRTHYLATFANMSTLMGLLGTIIGLIDAFTAVSNADPAEKAELLSASISIGMNCTAFGLMVAIPLVLVHSMLQTKTTEIIDSLEMASVKFLNAITERASGDAGPAPAPAPAPSKTGDAPRGAPVPRRA
jgi:biopolymer transport protein ExbB/TolQ